jgi:hypothetical protein
MVIEVKRRRMSVTQGEAVVVIDGKEIITFADTIEFIKEGMPFFGEKIGDWASIKPDSDFILGAIYHPYDATYNYSSKVKRAILQSC